MILFIIILNLKNIIIECLSFKESFLLLILNLFYYLR